MSRYDNPFPQHFDLNGAPNSGYTVYFGEENQDPKLFPKVPFSDSALTTPLPATLVLDSTGGYGIDFFLGGAYSIRIEDTFGALWRETPSFLGSLDLNSLGSLDNIAVDLYAFDVGPLTGNEVVNASGYYVPGDGGGGEFYWNINGTGPDDGGVNILPTGHVGNGRWRRIYQNEVDFRWFGAKGDAINDDAPAIQSALDLTGPVYGPDGNYKLGSQLVIKANTTLRMEEGCIMRRAWVGPSGERPDNATIKNENALLAAQIAIDPGPAVVTTWDEFISILGGQWGHLDDDPVTYRGSHIVLGGVRFGTLETTFKTQRSEWCTSLWLEDYHIPKMTFNVAEGGADVSNDGLHIIAGRNISVGNILGGVDDDIVAIGSNVNLGVDGVTIDSINCKTNANAMKVLQIRSGVTSGFAPPTELIQNISVGEIVGSVGASRTGVFDVLISGHTVFDIIRDVTVGQINVDYAGTHDIANSITIDVNCGVNITFGDIVINGTPTRDIFRGANITELNIGSLVAPMPLKTNARGIDLDTVERFTIGSGKIAANSQNAMRFLDVDSAYVGAVTAFDIPNGLSAISMDGSTGLSVGAGFKAVRVSGGTTSKGIKSELLATNTRLVISSAADFSEVDLPIEINTVPSVVAIPDQLAGITSVSVQSISATTTFDITDGHLFEITNDGVSRNFNPAAINFPDGWKVQVNNVSGVGNIVFDALDIAIAIVPGDSGSFYYSLAADAWRELA